MASVEIHFPREEFETRIANARALLSKRGLSALLIFAPESHYYLTGFDTTGFVYFQCGILTAEDTPITVLTRRPDQQQARDRSILTDIRVWYDAEDADPARQLKAILEEKGLARKKIGIELNNYGLTAANYQLVRQALEGWCRLEDASEIIRSLRLVKSASEIAHIRQAAALADAALNAMVAVTHPGVLESEITAAGLTAMLKGGGDVPPGAPLVNSGKRALYGRGVAGPRRLDINDQVTIELAATYLRYNACIMRTLVIGEPHAFHPEMFHITRDAIAAMTDVAYPGEPLGRIDEAHRLVYDDAGYRDHRFAACGYSLGATYRPSWMDVPPMLYAGNPVIAQPGMVLFLHAVCARADLGLAMSIGHTILITESGREVLSNLPHEFIVIQ
jgi:Xaa-Pro dipeptidase